METTTHLKYLLARHQQGIATPDESQMLYRMLNNPDKTEMEAIMNKEWSGVPCTNGEIDSFALLETIRRKAGIDPQPQKEKTLYLKPGVNRLFSLTAILRYAAIFIIAGALTWFLKPSPIQNAASTKTHFFNIKVAYGSKSTIELPDGSIVTLNSGSTLSYPDKFETGSRTVLLNGEAFFEVKKNANRPFYVKTKDITIKVLGTKFNVKSYPDENTSETTLVCGSVEILQNNGANNKTENENAHIFLKPNQKAIFTRKTGVTELQDLDQAREQPNESDKTSADAPIQLITKIAMQDQDETNSDIAWKNNNLILNNERFSDIIKKLERWYNVEITLENQALADDRFSGKFDRESITDVLNALNIIEPFHYEIKKNIIIISKK
ncbi:MAG: FecR family protein [Bacteroidota bacterium]|nr:FecR family protein [Bacteroidota bacterium]